MIPYRPDAYRADKRGLEEGLDQFNQAVEGKYAAQSFYRIDAG